MQCVKTSFLVPIFLRWLGQRKSGWSGTAQDHKEINKISLKGIVADTYTGLLMTCNGKRSILKEIFLNCRAIHRGRHYALQINNPYAPVQHPYPNCDFRCNTVAELRNPLCSHGLNTPSRISRIEMVNNCNSSKSR